MKKYKKQIIISSVMTILPMLIGILLWDSLPDKIATHFGMNNTPNGWSSKLFTVFGLPLMMVAIHLFTVLVTLNDPKKQNIGKKMLTFIFLIIPVTSWIVSIATYGYALGMSIDIGLLVNLLVGAIFIICGNYMSKNRQNYTVGIKLPWTLNSQENWNKTHRLASKLWVAAGLGFIANSFLQSNVVLAVIIIITILLPMTYSFVLYKKGI